MMQYSNQKGRHAFGEKQKETDEIGLMSWMGLPLKTGLEKDNLMPIDELFGIKTSSPIFAIP